MQAIILAGGFGTRLKHVVGDVPKPMAPVAGQPFLCWLLEYMSGQGVSEIVLCVHHQHEIIQRYFGSLSKGIRLHYLVEEKPLGTGGAMRQALNYLDTAKPVFALNGDSLVEVDYRRMMAAHLESGRPLTLATRHVLDCSRYSELTLRAGTVRQYALLGQSHPGEISTGLYVLSPGLFNAYDLPEAFSFEKDFLAPHVPRLLPAAYRDVEYFIDIGVPADYQRGAEEIPRRRAAA